MSNTSNVHRRVIKDITEGRTKLMEEYGIYLAPEEKDMYNVHFVMPGPDETPFEGGLYHGMIRLNPSHPLLPPNVYMFTPSGRFSPSGYPVEANNRGICFSYSSYHPEMWTPVNDIYKVMIGFISFMTDLSDYGAGCVDNPTNDNILKISKKSIETVKKDSVIKSLIPELYISLIDDSYVPPKMGELNKKTNKVSSKNIETERISSGISATVSKTQIISLNIPTKNIPSKNIPSKNKSVDKKIPKKLMTRNVSDSDSVDDSDNVDDSDSVDDSSGDLLEESDENESSEESIENESSEESDDTESEEIIVKNKVIKKAAIDKPVKQSEKKKISKVPPKKPIVIKKTKKRN